MDWIRKIVLYRDGVVDKKLRLKLEINIGNGEFISKVSRNLLV